MITNEGFCVVENVIDIQSCEFGIEALKSSYKQIETLIGQDRLNLAGEVGVVRAPMAFDPIFTLLENNNSDYSENIIDNTSILHLQNGFIFPKYNPNNEVSNFQNTFHADYPRYHNGYIASLNVLITFIDIDENDEIFYVVKVLINLKINLHRNTALKTKFQFLQKQDQF